MLKDREEELNQLLKYIGGPLILMAFFVALMWLFCGCSTMQSAAIQQALALPSTAVYKYDLYGSVNGIPFDGTGVFPRSAAYDMKIESKVDVDMLVITSCAHDNPVESAIELGWFDSKKGYKYHYVPEHGLEDSGSCMVRIGAYNKDKGANAWAILDFETPESTMPAEVLCNGSDTKANGVSMCQNRTGLLNIIKFSSPVEIDESALDPRCVPKEPADGLNWQYSMPQGVCVIAFVEKAHPHRVHRHTSVGYTDVLIRGDQ